MKRATPEAYELMHKGAIAFSEIEANGMRIDVDYLEDMSTKVKQRIKDIRSKLMAAEEYKTQRKLFGEKANIVSRDQLGKVLFVEMGYHARKHTGAGRPQLDEAALERIDSWYTRGFLKMEKLNKLHGTYIKGILRHVENGSLHPFFNLHTVRSYRSSSDQPNFQNIPIRNPEVAKIIRRAFIPRPGHAIVETDYSGQEVRIACAISGDEKLTYDTLEGDMHRDMAAECFMLKKNEVSKEARGTAKAAFVFAQFYGDWYKQCAVNLWEDIVRFGLKTTDGVLINNHLKGKGIDRLGQTVDKEPSLPGTFEHHIKEVEHRFWNKRFTKYGKLREKWVEDFTSRGWLELVTGFVIRGTLRKNQIINLPIQGPAFHCLLWSLIELVKEIRKWKTKIIGQVHDSIIADCHLDELDDYISLVKEISTERLPKAWKWLTVPLEMEAEVGYNNWYEKEPYDLP
jgi:DNA polymerase I